MFKPAPRVRSRLPPEVSAVRQVSTCHMKLRDHLGIVPLCYAWVSRHGLVKNESSVCVCLCSHMFSYIRPEIKVFNSLQYCNVGKTILSTTHD